jgi:hypothetical protein
LGSHTWAMHQDNGTPTDASDDLYNTIACEKCHGPVADLDINGAQTETHEMIEVLSDLIPASNLTTAQTNARWNLLFVEDDASMGVHNFPYARKLLVDATIALQATQPAPAKGDFNGDGIVNFTDIFMFTAAFGTSSSTAGWDAKYDLSGNGVVGFADWVMLVELFGKQTSSGKPVPVVAYNGANAGGTFDVVGSNRASIDNSHLAVTLTAQNMTQMRGYGVEIRYDADRLTFVRAIRAKDGLMPTDGAANLFVRETEKGRLTVGDATAGSKYASGSGPLADLVFKVNAPVDDSAVQIDLAQVADLNFGLNQPGAGSTAPASAAHVYSLGQNYPNPFNPSTTIRYSLAEAGAVRIVVYNNLGQDVRTLVDNQKLAGEYTAAWDGRDSRGREAASGVYVYRMEVNGFSQTGRMVLVK